MKYYQEGVRFAKAKWYKQAMLFFKVAILLDPNFSAAFKALGMVKVELKDYDGAFFDLGHAGALGDIEAYELRKRHVLHHINNKFREN